MKRRAAESFAIVNIGANVAGVPMSSTAWAAFQANTARVLRRHGRLVGKGTGTSNWENVPEVFATFHLAVAHADLPALRAALARLARRYEQEAVALVVCPESVLVRAESGVAAA